MVVVRWSTLINTDFLLANLNSGQNHSTVFRLEILSKQSFLEENTQVLMLAEFLSEKLETLNSCASSQTFDFKHKYCQHIHKYDGFSYSFGEFS